MNGTAQAAVNIVALAVKQTRSHAMKSRLALLYIRDDDLEGAVSKE